MILKSLFGIGEDLNALAELLDERSDNPAECQSAIDEWLSEIQDNLADKADNYAGLISELEGIAEVRATEAKRLASLADRDSRKAKMLRDRLKAFMEVTGMTKIKSKLHEFAIVRNGGLQPLELLAPADQLPERFRRLRIEPDNDAIRLALKEGELLEFARLGERGTRLRVS